MKYETRELLSSSLRILQAKIELLKARTDQKQLTKDETIKELIEIQDHVKKSLSIVLDI